MKLKTKLFFFIISVALVIWFIDNYTNKNNTIKRYEENIKALKDSTTYFKNELKQTVATKLVLQLTEKELKAEKKNNKDLKIALKNVKKPKVIIQTKQEVKIDTIKIPYKEEVECVFKRFTEVKKPYYAFNLSSTEKGNTISNFKLKPNKQTIILGDVKKGMFKNSELRVNITNSNKLFNQKNIKPIIIVYKKSWYEKPQITVPLGIVLGLLVD